MVFEEITVTSLLPVLVSMVITVGIVYILVQCVCNKKPSKDEPELTNVKHNSTVPPPEGALLQSNVNEADVHVEVETAVTPLANSLHSQNGTLHSRGPSIGNSVDLSKSDRHSGASSGSSPRPNTISRELPSIPGQSTKGFSHPQLPDIPPNPNHSSLQERDGNLSQRSSPAGTRSGFSSPDKISVIKANASKETDKNASNGLDDYDHIIETKKSKTRPRSDYDHVVLDGDSERIIPARQKRDSDDNDYAEVKNGNIYEGVPDEVMVIPISKPSSISVHIVNHPKKEVQKKSVDDPYTKIPVDEPSYKTATDDPYNRIKDENDPYNKVKGDIDDLDPYNTLKDTDSNSTRSSVRQNRTTPTNFKTDPYDPYSTTLDEERNVSNQTDPYSRVRDTESEIDDPYNKVNEDNVRTVNINTTIPDYTDDDYATVNKVEVEYAKVNKESIRDRHRNSGAVSDLDTENEKHSNHSNIGASGNIPSSPREEIIQDEYATVVKVRRLSPVSCTNNDGPSHSGASASSVAASDSTLGRGDHVTGVRSGSSNVQTPPEPPRGYSMDVSPDADHYNTVASVAQVPNIDLSASEQQPAEKKKEPPYNKLSVRESLASMNARSANNTYEYVSEVSDNLYATVEGNSGDGVVRPKSSAAPKEGRESCNSEYYTEIEGASAAPVPPSLHSLHETAKHHLVDTRRKDSRPGDLDYYNVDENTPGQQVKGHHRTSSGQGHHRTPSGQGSVVSSGHFRTPSGDLMTSSFEGKVTLATEENVDLDIDPNYQSVQEGKISDLNSEFDPNYETVEEAKSKAKYEEIKGARHKEPPVRNHIYEEADTKVKYEVVKDDLNPEEVKIRAHVYEEVTVTNEARRTRQRVLNQHTYVEVDEVKGRTPGSKSAKVQNQNTEGQSSSEVQNRKSGHERNSSGDQFRFGKRKSGELKEKKEKRKSDDKDSKKSGDGGKK